MKHFESNPTSRARTSLARWVVALLFLGTSACADDALGIDPDLEGGVLATFRVEGETFQFWSTNPATIEDILALAAGTSQAAIPNGPLRSGPGQGNHNAPWSWHLDPVQTTMAENTIEACSGLPSLVEEEITYWLGLGQYCPWSAELVKVEDFR